MKILGYCFIFFTAANAFGWGGRGHDTICQAAVKLIKNKELRLYFEVRPHVMGHLCNIPDTQWRDLAPEQTALGGPTHYVDADMFGTDFLSLPTDYQELVTKFQGKPSAHKNMPVKSIATEFGSNWWRADQFHRRAIEALKANDQYGFMVNLGLMGHFVGDNAQPLHLTVNYDGYLTGHGGLHAFYEEDVVGALGPKLLYDVFHEGERLLNDFQKTRKTKKTFSNTDFLRAETTIEKMRGLGILSFADLKELFKLDKIESPSQSRLEKGMDIKTPAVRKAPELVAKSFERLIVKEMGRASALLAVLWDEAYEKAGSPALVSGNSKRSKYPLSVEFVAPDYLPTK
ncbi:MAG: hypothetical protein V4736_13525 [Bdellovibrionota bacterium]